MVKNKGYEIEAHFKKELNGKASSHDFFDFETDDILYEVKSCKITVRCTNGNTRRPYVNQPHRYIKTRQYGKFRIYGMNHNALLKLAKLKKKKAKYILAVHYNDTMIHRVADARIFKIPDEEKWFHIPISQVFR